jgi:uncharacterized pyridoxal phosphate-containing UPF0001 family protein
VLFGYLKAADGFDLICLLDTLHDALPICRASPRALALEVTGLMCIPPVDEPAAPHFQLLRELAARHALPFLSMGMSADFETAVRLGATHVRLGTAIFGARGY